MPRYLPEDSKITIRNLLKDEWNHSAVQTYENDHADFEWAIDDHFEESKWIHTGWYDDQNPNPQITVSTRRDDPGSPTGYNSIDPSGAGPTAWMDGRVFVDTWVPADRDQTGNINYKKYAYQLGIRAAIIVDEHHDGTGDLLRLGTGTLEEQAEPNESPIGSRQRLPVFYGWYKDR